MATIPEAFAAAWEHHQAGRLEMAAQIYRQILAVDPNQVDALHLLGVVAHKTGRHEAAIDHIEAAIRLHPDNAGFHHNLGEAYRALHRIPQAIACYRRALQLDPTCADAHNGLGNVLDVLEESAEAISHFRQAIALRPGFAEACNNVGAVLMKSGRIGDAVSSYQRALQLKPDYSSAHNNLGNALKDQGRADEAVACYRRAMQLQPESAVMHSNFLLGMQYQFGMTPARLAEAHAEYEQQRAASLRRVWRPHENVRDPDRVLRAGFLSPDLLRHPVGCFLAPVLENLDQRQCETICYHDRIRYDDVTVRCQAAASAWRDVFGRTDEQIAEQIRADGIDILVDLAGHTANNRLLVFARKPAPIQISWLGYEGTTGLSAMDYLIADGNMVPAGGDTHYRECVVRLPDVYLCYDPPADAPPVSPLPAARGGEVTFGSFNNLAKIGPQVVAVWAEVLRKAPRARLLMMYRGLGDDAVRRRYLDLFAACRVDPERVLLLSAKPYAEYLAAYGQVDIALDAFPFSSSATTCEALWMGVPVITYPGETFAGRHGLTHLSSAGLAQEFVARDLSHYSDLAVRWAHDLERLAEIRSSLRQRMAAARLCDCRRFAANLAVSLRDVWRKLASGA